MNAITNKKPEKQNLSHKTLHLDGKKEKMIDCENVELENVQNFLNKTFPETKSIHPKLLKKLSSYTINQLKEGDWKLSKEDAALARLVKSFTEIETLNHFKFIKDHRNGTEKLRNRPLKALYQHKKTDHYYMVTTSAFRTDEINSYLGNLYKRYCKTNLGGCAPDIVLIYNQKKDKCHMGSKFLDHNFQLLGGYQFTQNEQAEVNGYRGFVYNGIFSNDLREDKNYYKLLASLLLCSDPDSHEANLFLAKQWNNEQQKIEYHFAKIDHDMSFMSMYSKNWKEIVDLVYKKHPFAKRGIDINKLADALESIINDSDNELEEEVSGYIHTLKSLKLDKWSSGMKLPYMPDCQYYPKLASIEEDMVEENPKTVIELLKQRKVVLTQLVKVLRIEACIRNDDMIEFQKWLKKDPSLIKNTMWFYPKNEANMFNYALVCRSKSVAAYLLLLCAEISTEDKTYKKTRLTEILLEAFFQPRLKGFTYAKLMEKHRGDIISILKQQFSLNEGKTMDVDLVNNYLEKHVKNILGLRFQYFLELLGEAFPGELDLKFTYNLLSILSKQDEGINVDYAWGLYDLFENLKNNEALKILLQKTENYRWQNNVLSSLRIKNLLK
ncbi:MAG: hypothetical protein COZ46_04240 [Verrucomicrobia bacterium CG_4_10_14_3_um_filter_43_23]|nr:MAG: hypothetical protein AUJ82_07585 [Verrucomicrobia bacterium CG1_02_43_26]PIP58635.1 MAG: hypothetical protein COX01_07810 [Verrucomicrobia bacterium CG22_combo_CG10-13_8_21_14_all_43_17]PIX58391.1 MAG: hypothetical protein COZ46_04240 [Verrucomicrobia bacterium CG_4_10_14_3_um_filter_43_23]PIY61229.1 MAG: hypothetical protein COY94_06460 [Verrucomicrobia bacterium CG_4_10_14_0_8_um_filter_43_34]PJA44956.1 MAG: hypothetical protein CO175_00095 [Verrucomicrobia bacterium CG_4_9_14_3_um_fi